MAFKYSPEKAGNYFLQSQYTIHKYDKSVKLLWEQDITVIGQEHGAYFGAVSCWSIVWPHARRKFVDALKYDKEKASEVLGLMGQLYELEQKMRDENLTWEQRTENRQKEAVPVLDRLKKWMEEHAHRVMPGSPLGQAIAYTLPRWEGLCAYAQHGQIEIDNNLIENAIRPLAIGRKNYLFTGSHDAADMTAAMYSFMATCKKNGVNELDWLTDALARIQSHKQKDLYKAPAK